jgi:predicted TIM-barrel fold metal-dependent hydrolase
MKTPSGFSTYKVWDVHVHNWLSLATLDAFEAFLAETGVSMVTVLGPLLGGYEPSPLEVENSNNRTLECMRRFPSQVRGLCYVNPQHRKHSLEEWRRCSLQGMDGIKLWVATLCSDARAEPVLAAAFDAGKPVLVHCWRKATGNLPHESTPDHVLEAAEKFPHGKFIMAHFGGDWEYGLRCIRDAKNVFADFSGTINEAGAYERAFEELGEDRVLFGTDGPANYHVCLQRVLGLPVPAATKRKILFENAARLFNHSWAAEREVARNPA